MSAYYSIQTQILALKFNYLKLIDFIPKVTPFVLIQSFKSLSQTASHSISPFLTNVGCVLRNKVLQKLMIARE